MIRIRKTIEITGEAAIKELKAKECLYYLKKYFDLFEELRKIETKINKISLKIRNEESKIKKILKPLFKSSNKKVVFEKNNLDLVKKYRDILENYVLYIKCLSLGLKLYQKVKKMNEKDAHKYLNELFSKL